MPRVLIVEDAEPCASTLEIAFSSLHGVTVSVLSSAQQALAEIERGGVGALVTDLNLPRMDGFELIERVRADARYRGLPIVVVSGDTDPDTPDRLRRLGADAYFTKPYSPAAVRGKLEQLLHEDQHRPPA